MNDFFSSIIQRHPDVPHDAPAAYLLWNKRIHTFCGSDRQPYPAEHVARHGEDFETFPVYRQPQFPGDEPVAFLHWHPLANTWTAISNYRTDDATLQRHALGVPCELIPVYRHAEEVACG